MLTTIIELVGALLIVTALSLAALAVTPGPWSWAVAAAVAGCGLVGLSALIGRRNQ